MIGLFRYICSVIGRRGKYWISYISYDNDYWLVYATRFKIGEGDILARRIKVIEGVNDIESYNEARSVAEFIERIPIEFNITV